MAIPTPPRDWDGFYAWINEIYWPSVPPDYRTDTRPNAPPGDPEVPSEIWRVALMTFTDPEAWLANPIPNQRNRSPLQLLGRGQGEVLKSILMEVAPFFLSPPDEIRSYSAVADAVSDEAAQAQREAAGDEDGGA